MRLALLAALAFAAPASAQMLPSGTWTGTLAHDGEAASVEALIERCATGFRVVLNADGRTAETETAQWDQGRLRFELPRLRLPGTLLPRTLACDLRADADGVLEGACAYGRQRRTLRLDPPTEAAFGCDGTASG